MEDLALDELRDFDPGGGHTISINEGAGASDKHDERDEEADEEEEAFLWRVEGGIDPGTEPCWNIGVIGFSKKHGKDDLKHQW